ncbi:unnamed protein product [Protopolystoma xenopodis]|uniref:Biotin carboxylation domain-containing protein n=1 Tax=Protopolystoma xenopodis TaxID=117903 RepID=A0A3S5BH79_9PLAT|nr:unnamed protein product [Protopolystoma xenopodis]
MVAPLDWESVRVDTGVLSGDSISVHYDPMIAKLIVWADNRSEALHRLSTALLNYHIVGLPTNLSLLRRLVRLPALVAGATHTGFITTHLAELAPSLPPHKSRHRMTRLAAAIWVFLEKAFTAIPRSPLARPNSFSFSPHGRFSGFRVNSSFVRRVSLELLGGAQGDTEALETTAARVNYLDPFRGLYLVNLSEEIDSGSSQRNKFQVF